VQYPHLPPGLGRFDLGLIECVLTIPLAIAFHFLWRQRPRFWGFYAGWMSVVYAPVRFGLDFLRVGPGDRLPADERYLGLTPAQWAAFGLFAFGIYLLRYGKRASGDVPATYAEARAMAREGRSEELADDDDDDDRAGVKRRAAAIVDDALAEGGRAAPRAPTSDAPRPRRRRRRAEAGGDVPATDVPATDAAAAGAAGRPAGRRPDDGPRSDDAGSDDDARPDDARADAPHGDGSLDGPRPERDGGGSA
jgi:hypothetical protein